MVQARQKTSRRRPLAPDRHRFFSKNSSEKVLAKNKIVEILFEVIFDGPRLILSAMAFDEDFLEDLECFWEDSKTLQKPSSSRFPISPTSAIFSLSLDVHACVGSTGL